jgi:thiamine-phosphate diphosphorylase
MHPFSMLVGAWRKNHSHKKRVMNMMKQRQTIVIVLALFLQVISPVFPLFLANQRYVRDGALLGRNRTPSHTKRSDITTTKRRRTDTMTLYHCAHAPFVAKEPPYLALITETNACDDEDKVNQTYETIKNALGKTNRNGIDLISIRVIKNNNDDNEILFQSRVVDLATRIMTLKDTLKQNASSSSSYYNASKYDFNVVINDNVNAAIAANVDGIHIKESKVSIIPKIRQDCEKQGSTMSIGTSAHNVDTALSTWKEYSPDYFFVGTCYVTKSHPEKGIDDLEGPSLPGRVKHAILDKVKERNDENNGEDSNNSIPIIFAIGGIDENNCDEPVRKYGADGVAVIRSIMQASAPRQVVLGMKYRMKESK